DNLLGGAGNDILVGGSGADTLDGGTGEDLLVCAGLSFDNEATGAVDPQALDAIFEEWTRTDANYQTRVGHLLGTQSGGVNGTTYLDSSVVSDDGVLDTVFGRAGQDWFVIGQGDNVRDRASNETITVVQF